jgi:cobalt-zinc-cadmium efflux system protein
VSLLAIWLAARPPTPTRPHGHPKATAYAEFVNGGWLLVLCVLVIIGAIDRLTTVVHQVHGLPVPVASGIAAATMFVGAVILGGEADDLDDKDEGGELYIRAVLLDTTADAAIAADVAVTG